MLKSMIKVGLIATAISGMVNGFEPSAVQAGATVEILTETQEEFNKINNELKEKGLDDVLSIEYLGYELKDSILTVTTRWTFEDEEMYLYDLNWIYDYDYEEYDESDAEMIYTEDHVNMWYGDDMIDMWCESMEEKYPWIDEL